MGEAVFHWFRQSNAVGIFIGHKSRQNEALLAFRDGLKRHGARSFVADAAHGWKPCRFAVTFGTYKPITERSRHVGQVIDAQRRNGGKHLVIELGYLHRDRYYMAGWGGLNGRADFRNARMPSDRFESLGIEIRPWREQGEQIVLCGQVPTDAAVCHIDYPAWCRETALALKQRASRPVIFRAHPMMPDAIDMSGTGVIPSRHALLQDDLTNAWCVVTFNSNAGVESAIEGVPVFAFDRGSMALPIASGNLDDLERPPTPDRRQWLANLAYAQWTVEEFRRGIAWDHLRRHLEDDEQCGESPLRAG